MILKLNIEQEKVIEMLMHYHDYINLKINQELLNQDLKSRNNFKLRFIKIQKRKYKEEIMIKNK